MDIQQKIEDHLMNRPISSIVVNSLEKDSDIALKVMSVVDYLVEKNGLYTEIMATPKLLDQLLRFRYFGLFRFYEYKMKRSLVGAKLLQCESCEFIAPYITTMEHMVLSHNRHKSSNQCQWCQKTALRAHEKFHTLENCYMNYKIKQQISSNYRCPDVIVKFYSLINKIANKLGVRITRAESYKAHDNKTPIMIEIDDDDDDDNDVDDDVINQDVPSHEMFLHGTTMKNKKTIDMHVLESMFREAMIYFDVPIGNDIRFPLNTLSPEDITAISVYSDNSLSDTPSPYNYSLSQSMSQPMRLPCYQPLYQPVPQQMSRPMSQSVPMPQPIQQNISQSIPQHTPQRAQQMSAYMLTPPIQINDTLTPPSQINTSFHGTQPSHIVNNELNEDNQMNTTTTGLNDRFREDMKFANYIASTVNNLHNESIRQRAKFHIHQVILQLTAEDLNLHFQDNN